MSNPDGRSSKSNSNEDTAPPPIKELKTARKEDITSENVDWSNVQHKPVDVLLLTSDDATFCAAVKTLSQPVRADSGTSLGPVYFGEIGKNRVALLKSFKGAMGVAGTEATCSEAIDILKPKTILSFGLCYGMNRDKVKIGDVLVSSKVAFSGPSRVNQDGTEYPRGPIVECDARLQRLFGDGKNDWSAAQNASVEPNVYVGELISGPQLIDHKEHKEKLRKRYPEALGGEMEGEGLYTVCKSKKLPWILCKGVSNWADGSNDGSCNDLAATTLVSFVEHVLKNNYVPGDTEVQRGFCIPPLEPNHEVPKREAIVRKFSDKMKELRENHPNSVTSLYLSGNPGCGKTQFARLLGNVMYAEKSFSFVFTLDASSPDSLYDSMFDLAVKLGWREEDLIKEVQQKDSLHKKFDKLCHLVGIKASKCQCWLLIVDGIGLHSLEKSMKFWRNSGIRTWGFGQVIITTQREDDIPECPGVLHKSLKEGLDNEEAIRLLKNISIAVGANDNDLEVMKEVAKELDYQPLALVNAALYIRRISKVNTNFNWASYKQKLLSGKQELMEEKVVNSPYSVGMVLATRLAVKELFSSSEILKHVFFALSFCAHAPVPVDLLVKYVKSKMDHVDDDDVLLELNQCCLFLWSSQFGVKTLAVHKVIYQSFLMLCNEEKDMNSRGGLFTTWLDTVETFAVESLTKKVRFAFSLLKPHLPLIKTTTTNEHNQQSFSSPAQNVLYDLELQSITKLTVFRQVYKIVHDLRNRLKYDETILLIQRAHPDICNSQVPTTMCRVGAGYRELGDLQKAEEHYLKSLEMDQSLYGESAPGIAVTLHELGGVYLSRGDLQKAEEFFLKSLEMDKSFYGESAPGIAVTLLQLGRVHFLRGNLRKACEFLLKCSEMSKPLDGESFPCSG